MVQIITKRKKQHLTFNDVQHGGIDAARHYGLSLREAEQEIRQHITGVKPEEGREIYKKFFREKK